MSLFNSLQLALFCRKIDWLWYARCATPSKKKKYISKLFLNKYLEEGEVDKAIIPYLKEINASKYLYTMFSCSGHADLEEPVSPYAGYLWIESYLPSSIVETGLVSPFCSGLYLEPTMDCVAYEEGDTDIYKFEIDESCFLMEKGSFILRWKSEADMAYILDNLLVYVRLFESKLGKN